MPGEQSLITGQIIIGQSGHGIMGSPSGGRILADTLAGKLDAADNPFHPGRFDAGSKPPDCEQIVL